MRKTLLVMVVLLFAAPAFAGTVALSVSDEGGGWAAIKYSADANVSGFGLKIYTDSDVNITDINDYNVGESVTGNKGFGIFPGTIDVNATTGLVDGNGTPIAPNDDPGASGTGLDTNTIVVEMGALYVDGNEPGLSGTLILVQVDGDCNVCVEGEPIRGNVVLTDANEAILSPAPPICAGITVPPTECFRVGQVRNGLTITAPMVALWVAKGKPPCWCYDCHHRADINGDCILDGTDILGFNPTSGWSYAFSSGYGADSDINYDNLIDGTDILGYDPGSGWNKFTSGCGTCTPGVIMNP